MTFCGSSVGSWRPGRLGPADCAGDALAAGVGDGAAAAAAIAAGALASASIAAAAHPTSASWSRRIVPPLADEARGQVHDRLREEAQDHADDGPDHQRFAALLTADRSLGQIEAGAENERQDADRQQDPL